jgi:hypothetical protein
MLISLTQDCYQAVKKLIEEAREQKRQMGKPDKTTFSEIVFMLIQKNQRPITTQNDGVRPYLDSSHLLISSRNDINDK